MDKSVVVVIGVGGMGQAIARRVGAGHTILLADFDEPTLSAAADRLRAEGHAVQVRGVDVSDVASVAGLATAAAELGRVTHVVHTAGLSPVQASAEAIVAVDLIGVALVLEEFARVVAPGGAGVVIASMAGHLAPALPAEQEQALALTPAGDLGELPFVREIEVPAQAYVVAKRANAIRVQAAAGAWGARGARVNSISPGVISTAMGQQELGGESGAGMRAMVEMSGTGRLGTPADIAEAAAFLLEAGAFVTGTDLLVDGGVVAAARSQAWAG